MRAVMKIYDKSKILLTVNGTGRSGVDVHNILLQRYDVEELFCVVQRMTTELEDDDAQGDMEAKIAALREALDVGDVCEVAVKAVDLGLRLQAHMLAPLDARQDLNRERQREIPTFLFGKWLTVSGLEQRMIELLKFRPSVPIDEFVKYCWNERYNKHTQKYSKARTILNRKLEAVGHFINVENDCVVLSPPF